MIDKAIMNSMLLQVPICLQLFTSLALIATEHLKFGLREIPKYFGFSRSDMVNTPTKALIVAYAEALFIERELELDRWGEIAAFTREIITANYQTILHRVGGIDKTNMEEWMGSRCSEEAKHYFANAKKCMRLVHKYYKKFKALDYNKSRV